MGPPHRRDEGSDYYRQEPDVRISVFKCRTTNRKSVWLRFSVATLVRKAESFSKIHVELHALYAALPVLVSIFFP
jgi:hypothetical protein